MGSMTTSSDPDCFSNVGGWVNIWAPGTDQVSHYPYGHGLGEMEWHQLRDGRRA